MKQILQEMTFVNKLGPKFLRFCMDLTIYAYRGDFEHYTKDIIFKSLESKISQPAFYVLKLAKYNDSIFVVTRGAVTTYDFQTILDMSEIKTEYGTFHSGFYKAAKFVYDKVKPILQDESNKSKQVYFVGHSLGGAVSASLILLFQNKNYKSIVFGAPPVVDLSHSMKYENCIASFVAEHDLIPTLSVPNIAKQLKERIPDSFTPEMLNSKDDQFHKRLINEFNKILDSFDTEGVPAGKEVVASLKNAAPLFIENVIQLIRDKLDKVVRFTPGCVFHITKMNTDSENKQIPLRKKKLSDFKVNATDELDILSSSKSAVADHPPGSYESCLDMLID